METLIEESEMKRREEAIPPKEPFDFWMGDQNHDKVLEFKPLVKLIVYTYPPLPVVEEKNIVKPPPEKLGEGTNKKVTNSA